MNRADGLQFLEQYSVVILPALVVAEQIGIPFPPCRPSSASGPSPPTDGSAFRS